MAFTSVPRHSSRRFLSIPKSTKNYARPFSWLDQAIARDPDFFLAYCQLASAHNYIYFFGFDHTPARLALADGALKALIRLRPEAGETHLARADFLYRCYLDYEKARAELAHRPTRLAE